MNLRVIAGRGELAIAFQQSRLELGRGRKRVGYQRRGDRANVRIERIQRQQVRLRKDLVQQRAETLVMVTPGG